MADNTQTVFRKKTLDPVRDELIADAVGLYAAFGRFDPEKEKLFLGVKGGRYVGGRLENYTDEPEKLAGPVSAELDRMETVIDTLVGGGALRPDRSWMNRQQAESNVSGDRRETNGDTTLHTDPGLVLPRLEKTALRRAEPVFPEDGVFRGRGLEAVLGLRRADGHRLGRAFRHTTEEIRALGEKRLHPPRADRGAAASGAGIPLLSRSLQAGRAVVHHRALQLQV